MKIKTGDKVKVVYGENKDYQGTAIVHEEKNFLGSTIYTKITIQLENGFTIEDVVGNCKAIF
jgi:ribosomal protein L24